MRNLVSGLVGRVRRFHRDREGVAALEFALIVPLLLLLLIGTAEASRAVSADRRLGQVTAMIADLIAREEAVTAADVKAIYAIVGQVMGAYDATSLKISLIPVMADPKNTGKTRVYPKTTNRPSFQGGEEPAQCAAYVVDSKLVPAGGTAIVVETSYTYQPIFAGYLFSAMNWTDRAVASPRRSCVDFDNDDCAPATCFP